MRRKNFCSSRAFRFDEWHKFLKSIVADVVGSDLGFRTQLFDSTSAMLTSYVNDTRTSLLCRLHLRGIWCSLLGSDSNEARRRIFDLLNAKKNPITLDVVNSFHWNWVRASGEAFSHGDKSRLLSLRDGTSRLQLAGPENEIRRSLIVGGAINTKRKWVRRWELASQLLLSARSPKCSERNPINSIAYEALKFYERENDCRNKFLSNLLVIGRKLLRDVYGCLSPLKGSFMHN